MPASRVQAAGGQPVACTFLLKGGTRFMTAALARTVLYPEHAALGARFAPFAGYEMPIQYAAGIVAEHEAARSGAVVFDTCHMGVILLQGPSALDDLENLVSCDVAPLQPGRCRYGLLCNENGGVLDDLLVYRLAPDSFMLVVNASTRGSDVEWITRHVSRSTRCADMSAETAKIDVQGPGSTRLLRPILGDVVASLRYYSFSESAFCGARILVSRTGYTGELGFELYAAPETILALWRGCLAAGALPAGLGARDTLRLEMGMPLYGHELGPGRNAAESGFTRALSRTKQFTGADAIRAAGRGPRLTGLRLDGRRAARQGDSVIRADNSQAGIVTSGSYAPSMGCAVALAYVAPDAAAPGARLNIAGARGTLSAETVSLPFYTCGTARDDGLLQG
ncbi:MAG: glycine cleavage system aminomethyltransferase GcvT [Lentisphaerae bacterium]|nr:glycine cleavage system aminomethyltransferase GcvT [Lentisphaerota bacterium]